jgi:hypothetical protein
MTTKSITIFRDVDMIGGNFIYTRSVYNSSFWTGVTSGTIDASNINFVLRNDARGIVYRTTV